MIAQQIAQEMKIAQKQVAETIQLLDESNTVPFIARYRKEVTGELDEEQIRTIQDRMGYLRNLEVRKEEVIRHIDQQGKLTPQLANEIESATTLQLVDDLYLPFRPKRRTRATVAKEKGLEPLADIIWLQDADLIPHEIAHTYINPEQGVESVVDALQGAADILAERISEDARLRQIVRQLTLGRGEIHSTIADQDKAVNYEPYHDFNNPLSSLPPHRILALNRGEQEEALKVRVVAPVAGILLRLEREVVSSPTPSAPLLRTTVADAYKRLLEPAIEREMRNLLTERADAHAINVFADNLRHLLLQPPIKDQVILGLDPAYRTGCKLAIVDPTGKVLETQTIYPHAPQNSWQQALEVMVRLIEKHNVTLIAIGNGTASRESEQLCAEVVKSVDQEVAYFIISEAGASVYSASKLARQELPNLDVSIRGAVSICRRALDPLAELVKIDPKSIGVGMYQHDVNQTNLGLALQVTVESCVNAVGVDCNTASPALLGYVAGISSSIANNIVKMRDEKGPFQSREEILKVPRLGPKTYEQCAGFLRIRQGSNPLDNTGVHPESYDVAHRLLAMASPKTAVADTLHLPELHHFLGQLAPHEVAQRLNTGVPTVRDIILELMKPGRDPRDDMPTPIFHKEVLTMEMLKPDMVMQGTVRNVIDFGAFVDIGVKQDGLVHISQLSHSYVRDPRKIVAVGDVVTVKVLDVDLKRGRVALTMKL